MNKKNKKALCEDPICTKSKILAKLKGFTLAEVLITMAILGVIAAILFPSILANYNERTLKAKRQALFGRMSQAMGEMANQFRKYRDVECTDYNDLTTCTDRGSAIKFVNEGFSKVYKVAAVCDSDNMSACDIPDEITREDGTTFSLKENGTSMLTYSKEIEKNSVSFPYDTNSVGVMTKNGESILLFYNPNCMTKSSNVGYSTYSEQKYCVNMIYDLNGGKKKPNKVGQDIGFMTVFYNNSPYVVSPRPYDWKAVPDYTSTNNEYGTTFLDESTLSTFAGAKAACAALGDNVGLPNLEEAMSMQINRELWAPKEDQKSLASKWGEWFWTSTTTRPNRGWRAYLSDSQRAEVTTDKALHLVLDDFDDETEYAVRCVYKD